MGKTPNADPSTIEEVNKGTLLGAMPISTANTGPSANNAPLAAPAASAAKHEIGAMRASQIRRGRTLRGWAGGSTLVIAIGTMASASSAPCDGEGGKAIRPERLKGQLSAGGGGEIRDLVEGVQRAAIGVGRLGVDPGLDDGVEPGKHEADQRATGEPGPWEEHDGHEDHGNDRQRDKGGVSPDVAAASDDRRRREGPGQHSGEIDGTKQADSQVGKALNAGS